MPPKAKVTGEITTAPDGRMLITEPDQSEDIEAQIAKLMESEGMSHGRVLLHRREKGAASSVYVASIPLEDCKGGLLELVKTRYGGGDYSARFVDASSRFVNNSMFSIDYKVVGEVERERRRAESPEVDPEEIAEKAAAKVAEKMGNKDDGAKDSIWLNMIAMQREQFQQTLALMAKSNSDMLAAIAGMNKGSAQGFDMMAALQVFDRLKGDAGSKLDGVIEILKFGKELAAENSKEESIWEKLLPLLPAVLGKVAGGPMPAEPQRTLPAPGEMPAPTPQRNGLTVMPEHREATANPPPANTTPDPATDMKAFIAAICRQRLPQLKTYAANDADPADVASMLSNPLMVPRAQFHELCELLKKETWLDDLFGGAPAVAPHEKWFTELRAEIIEEQKALLAPE